MLNIHCKVMSELGIHARAAGEIVKTARSYDCEITIRRKNNSCDLKDLLSVMRLGLKKGDEVTIFCKGKDEARVCEELALLFG